MVGTCSEIGSDNRAVSLRFPSLHVFGDVVGRATIGGVAALSNNGRKIIMRRGPAPKAGHLKLIEGNPGRRPIPKEVDPGPSPLPEPPDDLNPIAQAEWRRVAPGLHAMKLLHTVDTTALAAYCSAYATWRQAQSALAKMAERDELTAGMMIRTSNGNAIQNPMLGVSNKAARDMVRFAGEFGMTPSARARLGSETASQPTSKWAGLVGRAKA